MEQKFTDSNFEADVLNNEKPVLVDFFADWCGPCQMMAPLIEEIAKQYEGKATIGKLNVDDNPKTALKYRVMSIPTMIFFKNGEIAEKIIGASSQKDITDILDSLL